MAECVLKYSLFLLEIISLLTLSIIYGFLIFRMISFYFTDFSYTNRQYLSFNYDAFTNISEKTNTSVFNISITNDSINSSYKNITKKGIIIINNEFANYFRNNSTEILKEIKNGKYCFVFNSDSILYGNKYLYYIQKNSKEKFNLVAIIIILIFCLFLKIHLSKTNYKYIKTIEFIDENTNSENLITPFFNKIFFFNYVIFYFSIIFSITSLNLYYFQYEFKNCFKFDEFSLDSYSYDRVFIEDFKNQTPNILVNTSDMEIKKSFLFYEKNQIIIYNKIKSNTMNNLLFLCCMIWSCRYFDLFSNEMKISHYIYKNNQSNFSNKIIFSFTITLIIAYIIYGLMSFIDYFSLMISYFNYDLNRIYKNKNFCFFSAILIHIILYAIIIFCTVKNKLKQNFNKNNKIIVINQVAMLKKDFKIITNKRDSDNIDEKIDNEISLIEVVNDERDYGIHKLEFV